MSLPKIKESRDLSDAQVAEQILAVKRQLMELRLQQATGRMEKPHLFKHARHRLAQLMTVERERQVVADLALAQELTAAKAQQAASAAATTAASTTEASPE